VALLLSRASSTDVTEVVLEDSYHVATLDNDAPRIFAQSTAWIRERVAAGEPDVPLPDPS
jgi:carboxylesterase